MGDELTTDYLLKKNNGVKRSIMPTANHIWMQGTKNVLQFRNSISKFTFLYYFQKKKKCLLSYN